MSRLVLENAKQIHKRKRRSAGETWENSKRQTTRATRGHSLKLCAEKATQPNMICNEARIDSSVSASQIDNGKRNPRSAVVGEKNGVICTKMEVYSLTCQL